MNNFAFFFIIIIKKTLFCIRMRQNLKELSQIIKNQSSSLKEDEFELMNLLKKVDFLNQRIKTKKVALRDNLLKMKDIYSNRQKSKLKIL